MREKPLLAYKVLPYAQEILNKLNTEANLVSSVSETGGEDLFTNVAPVYDHEEDSGMRLYVMERVELKPFEPTLIKHGICIQPPKYHHTKIYPRSSTLKKRNIHVATGIIDHPYRGELMSCAVYIPFEAGIQRPVDVLAHIEFAINSDSYANMAPQIRRETFMVPHIALRSIMLHPGDRISQLVCEPVTFVQAREINDLGETSRGGGGFGSTGGITHE